MPFVAIDGRRIEYRMIPGDAARPPLVFLHEGLGSAGLWREFPDKVARSAGAPALVYSRFGYGQSAGLEGPRAPGFMHDEGLVVLPKLLDALGVSRPLLVGHSDGASIALIHAADSGRAVAGLALMAPHVFVEEVTVASIARVRAGFEASGLKARLAKYHTRVDDAFFGWADIWLDPAFRGWSIAAEAGRVTAPVLLIQGEDDEYGTIAQIEAIAARVRGPVAKLVLPQCRHSPHRDQEAAVVDAIAGFARGLVQ
jgi:pimeloyl-ACP methyl ester carboxylesterase